MEPAGVDPNARNTADGWEATPHQRFERLLHETGIFAGLLVSERNEPRDGEAYYLPELRLIYAPSRGNLRPSEGEPDHAAGMCNLLDG